MGDPDDLDGFDPSEIPDVIEPFTGYRTWHFAPVPTKEGGHPLRSRTYSDWWPTGVLEAHCADVDGCVPPSSPDNLAEHHLGYGCGIYTYRTAREVAVMNTAYIGDAKTPVIYGRVKVWGRYFEHDDGWRTQFAQIDALYVHPRQRGDAELVEKIERTAEMYGVPVEPFPLTDSEVRELRARGHTHVLSVQMARKHRLGWWLLLIVVGVIGSTYMAVGSYVRFSEGAWWACIIDALISLNLAAFAATWWRARSSP